MHRRCNIAVPGQKNHRQAAPGLYKTPLQIKPCHAGHADIQYSAPRTLEVVILKKRRRTFPILHLPAKRCEKGLLAFTKVIVIVDKTHQRRGQNAFHGKNPFRAANPEHRS